MRNSVQSAGNKYLEKVFTNNADLVKLKKLEIASLHSQ